MEYQSFRLGSMDVVVDVARNHYGGRCAPFAHAAHANCSGLSALATHNAHACMHGPRNVPPDAVLACHACHPCVLCVACNICCCTCAVARAPPVRQCLRLFGDFQWGRCVRILG
ncbi:hypothetical protein F511_46817 [Dorcoceras hygrometricum]|uniref:Uncharacterized protein n=1 Tax=Dorcoceras hygrometricum TaxID=472368 RepID=A0A2Z6ZZ21_9LAMI|nr:hypothetical protein F511_46817 [Dorcoceras hygrometricum]